MISQQDMMNEWLPKIEKDGLIYSKTTKVKARPAIKNEKIITITSDGKETENIAKENMNS